MTVRNLATAFAAGTVVALLVDVALQNAVAAVHSPGVDSLAPWWVIGRVMERSVWVCVALLVWMGTPAIARAVAELIPPHHHAGRGAAFRLTGRAMIVVPLLWLAATWLVAAGKMTLAGSWSSEGRLFISSSYYTSVLLGSAPWVGGGIVLLTLSRHVASD